jgi:succinate-semialdehyde dehydrogenase/glutarate-semialdehyde dehydrogenase
MTACHHRDRNKESVVEYPELSLFIDGQWLSIAGRDASDVINPATGACLGQLPIATLADVDAALDAAQRAFPAWRATPAIERSNILRRAASLIRDRLDHYAWVMTSEQGKPLGEARREAGVAAEMFEWAAEESRRLYGRLIPPRTPRTWQMAVPEPIGPVGGFSGWNAPAGTPSRKISSALAAGCTLVIKPAEETPASALFLARALVDAGLPKGVLNMVFGNPAETSRRIVESPVTRAITFTGSTAIGRQIAVMAAPGFKRTILELGGHAPVLVFADADIQHAANTITQAKFRNAGQICTSPTRILVHESVAAELGDAIAQRARSLRIGNGLAKDVQMGPLSNPRRIAAVTEMVEDATSRGGALLAGGKRIGTEGWFMEPTVISGYDPSWKAAQVEPFGPLAILKSFAQLDEAIAEANRLPFGLAAYVFTRNTTTAMNASDAIESGVVCINNCQHAFPETPFGGVKDSGLGKEGGIEGIEAFTQYKYVSQT